LFFILFTLGIPLIDLGVQRGGCDVRPGAGVRVGVAESVAVGVSVGVLVRVGVAVGVSVDGIPTSNMIATIRAFVVNQKITHHILFSVEMDFQSRLWNFLHGKICIIE